MKRGNGFQRNRIRSNSTPGSLYEVGMQHGKYTTSTKIASFAKLYFCIKEVSEWSCPSPVLDFANLHRKKLQCLVYKLLHTLKSSSDPPSPYQTFLFSLFHHFIVSSPTTPHPHTHSAENVCFVQFRSTSAVRTYRAHNRALAE